MPVYRPWRPAPPGRGVRQTARSAGKDYRTKASLVENVHLVPGLLVQGEAGPVDQEARPLGARLPVVLRVQVSRHTNVFRVLPGKKRQSWYLGFILNNVLQFEFCLSVLQNGY